MRFGLQIGLQKIKWEQVSLLQEWARWLGIFCWQLKIVI